MYLNLTSCHHVKRHENRHCAVCNICWLFKKPYNGQHTVLKLGFYYLPFHLHGFEGNMSFIWRRWLWLWTIFNESVMNFPPHLSKQLSQWYSSYKSILFQKYIMKFEYQYLQIKGVQDIQPASPPQFHNCGGLPK